MAKRLGCLFFVSALLTSCHSPSAPTHKPVTLSDFRYEDVSGFQFPADAIVELEFWDATNAGKLPGLQGPYTCTMISSDGRNFRCPAEYTLTVASDMDHAVDVLIRNAAHSQLLETAHDVYVHGTRVSRFIPVPHETYLLGPSERSLIQADAAGHVH